MKTFFNLLVLLALIIPVSVSAKDKNDGKVAEYQVTGGGTATDASVMYKVTILSKKKEIQDSELGKCAVHAALFRDVEDTTNTGFGSSAAKKAIMRSPGAEVQYKDFFEPFFANGDCNAYVQDIRDFSRVKSDKVWKITATVKVNTAQLRSDLQKRGMLKNLSSGF